MDSNFKKVTDDLSEVEGTGPDPTPSDSTRSFRLLARGLRTVGDRIVVATPRVQNLLLPVVVDGWVEEEGLDGCLEEEDCEEQKYVESLECEYRPCVGVVEEEYGICLTRVEKEHDPEENVAKVTIE